MIYNSNNNNNKQENLKDKYRMNLDYGSCNILSNSITFGLNNKTPCSTGGGVNNITNSNEKPLNSKDNNSLKSKSTALKKIKNFQYASLNINKIGLIKVSYFYVKIRTMLRRRITTAIATTLHRI